VSHLCVNTLPASWQSVYTRIYDVFTHVYTTLAFLALLGAPYIYDISSLRVKRHYNRQVKLKLALIVETKCFAADGRGN